MKTMQMNRIGLDEDQVVTLARRLNELLADYQIFYLNTRGYHWNIKGEKFFELHVKFEELYTDLLVKIDEIAERVLTLGETPDHTFADYLEKADVEVHHHVADGRTAIGQILEAFKIIIGKQRVLLVQSAEAADEGTNALMSDYIREQEKLVWMYAAFLG
ncbi:MAG: Dps family protein [Saprospiraceae bacterium]